MKTYCLSTGGNTRALFPSEEKGNNREVFIPRLVSWNTTFNCNLRCPHCYIDAGERKTKVELTTAEGKLLIDQITEVSKPLLIFSGGEPLLRSDIFELAQYATEKGLKAAMGTNGTLISDPVAERLMSCGVKAVAISIDSSLPERHDGFRGMKGSWRRAMAGIEACTRSGIDVQVNTTVTQQNYNEIDKILALAEKLGAQSFHLFFLVPTGRGYNIKDITADMYEHMIEGVLDKITTTYPTMKVRPVCAPQFLRIASQKGMDLKQWGRGCIAGLTYCRIYPTGEVTPCPYLPITLGNIRQTRFKDIWFKSPVFKALRDRRQLMGKCGRCEYREVCGGCRARAYGLTGPVNICGGLHQPGELHSEYLAEEPWCPYQPKEGET
jgi:radical SAM protein with 4Fe4S-binding SPASM domain